MAEILSMAAMQARYPDEWVLIDRPQVDQANEVLRGEVVFHSKDRDEVWRQACTLPVPREFAVEFMGELFPADNETEYIL